MATQSESRGPVLAWRCNSCEHYWPFDAFDPKPGSKTEPKSQCKACEAIDAVGAQPEMREWAVTQMAYLLRAIARSRLDLVGRFPFPQRNPAAIPFGFDPRPRGRR